MARGSGGAGGAGAGAGGATGGAGGATAGASGAGGAAAGADGGSDATDAPTTNDAASETTSTTDAAGDALDDAGLEAPPPFDAGADCIAPSGETVLSATAEGLPSAGLVLWLRGDHGVYKTAAQGVCAWADQSGNHGIMTGTGSQPTWAATGLGGQAAIHFMSSGQQLGTGGVLGLAPTSARTIVAVSALVATTPRFQPWFQGQIASPGTYLGLDENTFNTAGSREGVYLTNNAYDATLATSTSPRVHVYTISTMTPGTPILGNIDYRVNGATQTLTRTSGGLGDGNVEDFSAANATSVGAGAEGIIAEVLVYDRALTVDERGTLETALETRYAIH